MNTSTADPLKAELEKAILGIVTAVPGITLAVCIQAFKNVFDPGDVRDAVSNLARDHRIRLEAQIDQLPSGIVGNVRLRLPSE